MKIAIFWLILIFAGCTKNSTSEKDRELPVITLFTPVEDHVYSPGQVIKIAGKITDNVSIAEVHVVLSNNTTGGDILHAHMNDLSDSASFEYNNITAKTATEYKVVVTAIDRSRNESYLRVIFSSN